MVRNSVLQTKNARAVVRKAGFRIPFSEELSSREAPTPILSLNGNKGGCSTELQSLIYAYRADGTTESRQALFDYIENHLGQSVKQAYPAEWEAAHNGQTQVITMDLGADTLTLTLYACSTDQECRAEIAALVAALNASPTQANSLALVLFLQNQTGLPIEVLVPEWNLVIDDGQERTSVIEVCGAEVTLTISGTHTSTTTCSHLPSYGLSWPQNDFDMPCIRTNNIHFHCASQSVQVFNLTFPDITLHMDDPEFVYLEGEYDESGSLDTTRGQIGHNRRMGWHGGIGGNWPLAGLEVGGKSYYPYFRVKHRWSCKIASGWQSLHDIIIGGPNHGQCFERTGNRHYYYYTKYPIMGIHPMMRYESNPPTPPGSGHSGFRTTADPLFLGTIGAGTSGGLSVFDSDLPTLFTTDTDLWQRNSWSQKNTDYQNDRSYSLHVTARGSPTETEYRHMLEFEGMSNQSQGEDMTDAWDEFVADVAAYQAATGASPYDPDVTLDEENMMVHVSCETDQNALYLPLPMCGRPPVTGQPTPFTSWVVSWGSWWMEQEVNSRPSVGMRFVTDVNPQGDDGYASNDRWLVDPRWLTSFAHRILANYPEDNADYFMTDYRRVLSITAGDYKPGLEAGTEPAGAQPCRVDARCITPGPP